MPIVPFPSPYPAPVRGQVQFSAPEFVALYPEFTGIATGALENAFGIAILLLSNGPYSAVQDANARLVLLYMLTAHVCFLNSGTNDGAGNVVPPPGIVGRINSAAEGSVSVSAEYATEMSQSMAFFTQTKYGAQFWQATVAYRTMRIYPAPRHGPNGPGFPWSAEAPGWP